MDLTNFNGHVNGPSCSMNSALAWPYFFHLHKGVATSHVTSLYSDKQCCNPHEVEMIYGVYWLAFDSPMGGNSFFICLSFLFQVDRASTNGMRLKAITRSKKSTHIIFGRLGVLVACSWHITEAEPFFLSGFQELLCQKHTEKPRCCLLDPHEDSTPMDCFAGMVRKDEKGWRHHVRLKNTWNQ